MSAPIDGVDLDQLTPQRRELVERLLRQRQAGATPATPTRSAEPAAPAAVPGRRPALAVSLFFFSADLDDAPADKYDLVLRCAELADELGLHAVWVPERHFDPFGAPYPAPAVLLAAIAARTRRIGLRAGSVVLPLHDPLLVAEEWGVLDAISRGRVALSLASGWHADDFVLDPDSYERRKEVLTERLEVLRTLWRGDGSLRAAPQGRTIETRTYPRPARPLETWLTSSSNPQTWRTAGALDLHVLTAMLEQTVDDIAEKVTLYQKARAEAGHVSDDRQVTCMLHTHLAERAEDVVPRVREPLGRYLSAHLNLFEKFASTQDVGVRPEEVTEADRALLLEHGLQRYLRQSGLFGSVETCLPMVDRLVAAGVTELGCLVDFGLPDEQVFECVRQLGRLQEQVRDRAEEAR
ncbi:natural product biosynthesis luciferase-like monooxygenase domain-containing protein [Micromonospora nigra]|uniref:Natural product biosynthesis luciferase-like monooxygenase domain-containing protein n=1 Tax=Micromonospora nigra TaxID=145857 RepID=A0A1C6RBR7_9ACTN|nr:MupA/Atu3671 family FMN-dependent luciferase-like monooxygenase [Micromonospora nigra]SCL14596.1 natural product biosynthesis luciferase-like monooxygenase domain-containing protein [Micromonospora nigra]